MDAVRPLFEAADRGEVELVTSAITLLEMLVVPHRAGDIALARRYEELLGRSRGVTLVDPGRPILRAAAHLRARHGVRTPDALQLAYARDGNRRGRGPAGRGRLAPGWEARQAGRDPTAIPSTAGAAQP